MSLRGRPPGPNHPSLLPFAASPTAPLELGGAPSCPKYLDAVAKKRWRELVKELTSLGLIDKAVRDTMASYCIEYSRKLMAEAELRKKKTGPVIKSADGGLYRCPYLDVANYAAKAMLKLAGELGLTQGSRKKLGVKPSGKSGVAVRDRGNKGTA